MKIKTKLLSLISMLITCATLLGTSVTLPAAAQATILYLDPSSFSELPTASFIVNINIMDVIDLYAWGIRLMWKPEILNCTDVAQGPFLTGPQGTGFTKVINRLEGFIDLGCTLIGDIPGVSGSGTLATVTFEVLDVGETSLHLYDTELLDSYLNTITHMTADGSFSNVALLPILANMLHKSAWPEHHHFVISKDEGYPDSLQTLYALIENQGSNDVYVKGSFNIVREDGKPTYVETNEALITPGTMIPLTGDFGPLVPSDVGKYQVTAKALYSYAGYMWYEGTKVKTFSFAVVG